MKQSSQYIWILMFVAMVAVFYFAAIRPQSKQRKAHQQLMSTLKKGDQIRTYSGIFGKVTKVDDTLVVIEIAKGVTMKILRGAVAEIIRDKEKAKALAPEGTATSGAATGRKAKADNDADASEDESAADGIDESEKS